MCQQNATTRDSGFTALTNRRTPNAWHDNTGLRMRSVFANINRRQKRTSTCSDRRCLNRSESPEVRKGKRKKADRNPKNPSAFFSSGSIQVSQAFNFDTLSISVVRFSGEPQSLSICCTFGSDCFLRAVRVRDLTPNQSLSEKR